MAGGRRDRVLYALAALVAVVVAVLSVGSDAHADPKGNGAIAVRGAAQLELAPLFLLAGLMLALGMTWYAARRDRVEDDSHLD